MKVRQGFVSNSSSSSFIVAWPKPPSTPEDIADALFGSVDSQYPHPYADLYPNESDKDFTALSVSSYIHQSLNSNQDEVKQILVEEFKAEIDNLLCGLRSQNSYCMTGAGYGFEACSTRAKRKVNQYVDQLVAKYPRTAWMRKFSEIMCMYNELHDDYEKAHNEEYAISARLKQVYSVETTNYDFYQYCMQNGDYVKAREIANQKYRLTYENRELNEAFKLIATKLAEIFFTDNTGKTITQCEIGDDSTLGSAIEHGPIFDKLPHLTFSHH